MTNTELSEFIKNYIEHDKTQSAIMLTAPWGAGKSYYIETDLVPFLKCEENGSHECVVVSLYGLSSLFELSKALYMESRMRFLSKGAEKVTTSIFAAKTILKGAASFFGIDLSKSQEEMKQLYDSIDLSGKLIILEDLERSGIDILEILGYVNSLTEQDGVKVLLVANEHELIHYERENAKTKEQQDIDDTVDRITDNKYRNHTEKTKTYLSTKEKTVSDTILYEGDVASAVLKIMSEYNKTYFGCFTTEAGKNEVTKYLQACDITNLRTFKFACQKANDIFERIKPNPETEYDYIKTIFFSIITFSQKIKSGKKEKWDGGRVFSTGLSSEKYPLFRFCYDYIMWQSFDESRVAGTKEALEKLRLYDKDKSLDDKDLHVLFSWWTRSEKDVNEAIKSITEKLKKEDSIAFYSYGKIAVEIIRAKAVIGCDIEETKELMVKNLYNKGSQIDADYLFLATMIDENNPAVFAEYTQLKDALTASLAAKETTIFGFDYKEESIENLCLSVYQNDGRIYRDGEFATRLDMNKFVEMLKGCTAQNISRTRDVFLFLYRSGNIKDFLEGDRETLETLLKYTQALESFEGYDKIQKMQMRFFSNNLKDIIDKL